MRHYKFVLTDPAPSEKERVTLRDAYRRQFPKYLDTAVIIKTQIDSAAYLNSVNTQNQLLDEVIKAYGQIDSLLAKDSTTGVRLCIYSRSDSARIVKHFLSSYKPPPVIVYTEKEVPYKDDGDLAKAYQEIHELQRENDGLKIQRDAAIDNRKKAKTNLTWLYIVAGLLLAGNVYQLVGKNKLV